MASKKKPYKSSAKNKTKKGHKPAPKKTTQAKANPFNIKDIFPNMKKGETTRFIIGLVLICTALILAVSFISFIFTGREDAVNLEVITSHSGEITHVYNRGGIWGLRAANYFMQHCFGFTAIFIPLFMLLLSLKLMKTHIIRITQYFIYCAFLMIWGSVFLAYLFPDGIDIFKPGGDHGINISHFVISKIGEIGLVMVLAVTMIIFCIYLTSKTIDFIRSLMHPKEQIKGLTHKIRDYKGTLSSNHEEDGDEEEDTLPQGDADSDLDNNPNYGDEEQAPVIDLSDNNPEQTAAEEALTAGNHEALTPLEITEPNDYEPNNSELGSNNSNQGTNNSELGQNNSVELEIEQITDEDTGSNKIERGNINTPYDPHLDFENYHFPTISLLKHYDQDHAGVDMQEQQENKNRIIEVLRNFGVEISSIKATIGPTITLYEITPAKGVRIIKIQHLEADIALSLKAIGIRIIAPIPGKGTIGIEVPNKNPKIVSMESVINSRKFKECEYDLPIALGRTITNEIYIQDLAKCPHLLVAGATGQGKSVGLNAIITSLLYKKHPTDLKFVLVDPKKVELSIYAPLEKNYMAEIAECEGDPVITDTERVKHTLKSLCQEMDDRYMMLKNARCRNIKEYNEKFCKQRTLSPANGYRYLPYIVVIIDEYGDLIMTAGKEIEKYITRIAQLARAVGIHMVIATQRPTTNIITGTIKANFPSRMAFRVMASIDSRTILDRGGADQLIGRGDMLFLANGKMPERVQCAFVDTPEVEAICDFISEQDGPLTPYVLPDVAMDDSDPMESGDGDGAVIRYDSMFADVARFVVNNQQGSTSAIQRTFAIGYNRAGRLMDQLEKAQIVGPARGSKPRDVLIMDEATLNIKMEALHII